MNRIHAAVITLIVGSSVAVGGVALSRSGADGATRVPAGITTVDGRTLTQRAASLDALEASLDRQEAARPPAAAARTITVTARPPGTLAQRDDDHGVSGKRHDDDSGEDEGGEDD